MQSRTKVDRALWISMKWFAFIRSRTLHATVKAACAIETSLLASILRYVVGSGESSSLALFEMPFSVFVFFAAHHGV